MKKLSYLLIVALAFLILTPTSADESMNEYYYSNIWQTEAIKISFDGIINANGVGTAQKYEVTFSLPETGEFYIPVLSDSIRIQQFSSGQDENLLEYISESGEILSFSYGDFEYASKKTRDIYEPLFSNAVDRNIIQGTSLNAEVPVIDGLLYSDALTQLESVAQALKIDFLQPSMVYWFTKDDIDKICISISNNTRIRYGEPFYVIFLPVSFMDLPVIEQPLVTISNQIINGVQGQAIVSKDGIEFFYSGRNISPMIVPSSEDEICMSFELTMQQLIHSFDNIILSEPTELLFYSAEVCYIPIPLDQKYQKFIYSPYWFLHHVDGMVVINALNGERLL